MCLPACDKLTPLVLEAIAQGCTRLVELRARASALGVQIHTFYIGEGAYPPVLSRLAQDTGASRFQAVPADVDCDPLGGPASSLGSLFDEHGNLIEQGPICNMRVFAL